MMAKITLSVPAPQKGAMNPSGSEAIANPFHAGLLGPGT